MSFLHQQSWRADPLLAVKESASFTDGPSAVVSHRIQRAGRLQEYFATKLPIWLQVILRKAEKQSCESHPFRVDRKLVAKFGGRHSLSVFFGNIVGDSFVERPSGRAGVQKQAYCQHHTSHPNLPVRQHLGTFDGEGKRREPRFQPLDTAASQIAGLGITCAILIVVAFVVGAL